MTHRCVWFHSADARHNISCCRLHELWVDSMQQYVTFSADTCPRCAWGAKGDELVCHEN